MKITITSIELKNPFKFFALSKSALQILRQLKTTNCVAMKKRGLWTTHYTMTMWKTEKDLKDFAASGAHLKAMKESSMIAKEIRTLTIDADVFPTWAAAKKMLENAHVLTFK
ncbi:MAG: hypothetical protein ACPG5B_17085 [Chitinophagales bacterium]